MKLAIVLSLAASALVLAAPAPEPAKLQKRLLCQVCNVGGLEGGDACCSLHCIIEEETIHGGHCDENGYCICN